MGWEETNPSNIRINICNICLNDVSIVPRGEKYGCPYKKYSC
jgi:hypothetical protein